MPVYDQKKLQASQTTSVRQDTQQICPKASLSHLTRAELKSMGSGGTQMWL